MMKLRLMGWAEGNVFFVTKIDFKSGKVYGESEEGEFAYKEEDVDIYIAANEKIGG